MSISLSYYMIANETREIYLKESSLVNKETVEINERIRLFLSTLEICSDPEMRDKSLAQRALWAKEAVTDRVEKDFILATEEPKKAEKAEKPCKGCGIILSLSEFYRQVSTKDGRRTKCKKCTNMVDFQ